MYRSFDLCGHLAGIMVHYDFCLFVKLLNNISALGGMFIKNGTLTHLL